MNVFKRINNYINDDSYQITICENYVHIANYQELVDFSNQEIVVKNKKNLTIIEGENLLINRIMDGEILIFGDIKRIRL